MIKNIKISSQVKYLIRRLAEGIIAPVSIKNGGKTWYVRCKY